MNKLLDRVGDWNPQLFRELKGRFNLRNGAIAIGGSLFFQLFLLFIYSGQLPNSLDINQYNRYCNGLGDEYTQSTYQCIKNAWGDGWEINWQLWHFDFFICLSLLGMVGLLLIGSHLIGADLVQEERRGTLGFVRLSPQALQRIIMGKILGVPSLVYLGMAAALPLHLWMGLQAQIALFWIVMVDLVAIAACVGFFTLAAMWSFVGQEFFGGMQAWLYSAALSFYLLLMTILTLDSNLPSDTPFDWLRMFYPANVFYYLVNVSSLGVERLRYWEPDDWFQTEWYGASDWSGLVSLGIIFGHYLILAAIAWHGIERRFYEPEATLISKKMGYFVALLSTIMVTGFATVGDYAYQLLKNFQTMQVIYYGILIALILAMTPTRQRIQDWSRLRHQGRFAGRLWSDLLVGDRSPAILAIGMMLSLSTAMMSCIVLTHPLLTDKNIVIQGLMLQAGFLFITACLIQFIFLQTKKRGVLLIVTLSTITILPFLLFAIFHGRFVAVNVLGLFSAFPTMAVEEAAASLVMWSLASEFLAMLGSVYVLHKRIQSLGNSELKTLLATKVESPENMLT
jgi:hypothetical protein